MTLFIAAFILCLRACGVYSSYINVPRIAFAGLFRADIPTANNDVSSFAFAAGYTENEFIPNWNAQGSGEFSLINCTVRSVTYSNGTTSQRDALVGSRVVVNQRSSPAKMAGLDIAAIFYSTIYGMELALQQDATTAPAFVGSSAPFLVEQDGWANVPCAPAGSWFVSGLAAHGATVLKNITWSTEGSEILQQLQAGGKELSVALAMYSQCPIDVATQQLTDCENTGYVVGTIGVVQSDSDPAAFSSFASHRIMTFDGVEQPEIAWPQEDACSNPLLTRGVLWMYKAYFDIDTTHKAVRVDFSNAFSKNADGFTVKDFGSELSLAILDEELSCVRVLADGAIPYREAGWFENSAGMFDASLTDEEMQLVVDKPLVVVRLVPSGASRSVTDYPLCANSTGNNDHYQLMLKESPYFVRPRNTYVFRMEAGDTANTSLYVTHFGRPSANTAVIVKQSSPAEGTPTSDGVAVLQQEGITDDQGVVHYKFVAKSKKQLPNCGLDFQIFRFIYRLKEDTSSCFVPLFPPYYTCINPFGFLLWRDDSEIYRPPYSWQEHAAPIFKKYAILYPVMKTILNLSNFSDVTQPKNIRLLRFALTLDFNHPSYMPATRDLSPTKQNAIVEWLDDPLYESPISLVSSDIIALCNAPILFHSSSGDKATCSSASFGLHPHFAECAHFDWKSAKPSSMAEWQKDALKGSCSLGGLQRQLQQAIELEFATIPLYLTSLFSIKEGYNREVYNIIRTVVLQEMLHLAQAANLLIAVKGSPQIDNKMAAPHYPGMGLPGNVLPNLNVTLRRASREHIYEVFMALEHPHHFTMANSTTHSTIGDFYDQVLQCMEHLRSRKVPLFKESRARKQIEWPWEENDYGHLYVVNNLDDARAAIAAIREQGEGSTPVDPTYSESHDLAHFFQFEQIVCGRRLVYDRLSNRHSFIGESVELDPKGVWPVRDNPGRKGLTPGTRAYTVAWAFHKQYRSLLRQLQAVFDGNPEGIKNTVATMETLIAFGKRAAAEKMDPELCDSETAGPVWDYEWED